MKFKEYSTQKIRDIEDAQRRHHKDILQPRDGDGNIDQEFLKVHGAKNLNISEHDISKMSKKNLRMAKYLSDARKKNLTIK